MMMTTTPAPAQAAGGYDFSVGTAIPANMAHAVSVSLPKWQDNVDYEEGRLGDVMQIGYPRFFVHKSIQKLAAVLLRKFGTPGLADHEPESCYLFPSARVADRCRSYMRAQYAVQNQQATSSLPIRVVQFSLVLPASTATTPAGSTEQSLAAAPVQLYIVLFPASAAPIAKSYWQHTGDGISSRLAEHCLSILEETGRLGDESTASPSGAATPAAEESPSSSMILTNPATAAAEPVHRRYSKNRHYSRGGAVAAAPVAHALANSTTSSATPAAIAQKDSADPDAELMSGDQSAYVEERYGRNLPASSAPLAKRALRRRIAGTLLSDRDGATDAGAPDVGPTAREGTNLSEDDVFLYPSGMSSIFHAHQVALRWRQGSVEGVGKSVCFGFPYTDTLKILQKWGPGCHFFGKGSDDELDELEEILKAQKQPQADGASPAPILALFCEFPSNPLLRCPDLPRIRRLAEEHDFLVVVDETIGNFLNVEVLPYADIVVSSLTKVFSGDANVMGGSMVVNPKGRHAGEIREVLVQGGEYEDNYWGVDAVFMERNSRDFARRVQRIDANAEALATMLHTRLGGSVVKGVYYPKFETRAHYDACRRKKALPYPRDTPSSAGTTVDASIATREQHEGGFGGLFSVIFTTLAASQAFYDALSCAKGPSLGTNFTLASPYTLLAHYNELDWAKEFGVEATLVRVSTGLEETEGLVKMFERALEKAEEAEKAAH